MKEKIYGKSFFKPHIEFAHACWGEILQPGDWAIDATCGNGHDTLKLAQICGRVIGLDIQKIAIEKTRERLVENGVNLTEICLFHQSHETFPEMVKGLKIRLIVYNLGYLPGKDKSMTTRVSSTLASLQEAQKILSDGGMISITCYPGHPEGKKEQTALLEACSSLSSKEWSVSHHEWINREKAPSLLLHRKKPTK